MRKNLFRANASGFSFQPFQSGFNQGIGKLSRQTINHELSEATTRLNWTKHVTAHILRHSFASTLVRNNASLPAVQSLFGHSDLRVTSRYIHQDLGQLQAAVNLI